MTKMLTNANKGIFFTAMVFLSLGLSVGPAIADSPPEEQDHYRVEFSPDAVSMNLTIMMRRGEIKEFNVSVENDNSSMTLIIEILHDSGRLWGLYFEENTTYYAAKTSGVYSSLTKLMDHVTVYTTVHITRTPEVPHVLALHDAHMHEEPDAYFNLLVLKGHSGVQTHIVPNIASHDHDNQSTQKDLGGFAFFFSIAIAVVCYAMLFKSRRL
ncbi:MAG: hypothetical protein ACE5OZ_00820 [Candidatus Heimdallarchaeota archaeon]